MKKGEGKGRVLCYDSENVGFIGAVKTPKDCHIIYTIDAETRESFIFFDDFKDRVDAGDLGDWETMKDGTYGEGVRFLSEARTRIIQNEAGYDGHVFEATYPQYFNVKMNYFEKRSDDNFPFVLMDTLVMSQALNPERKVPHQAYALGKGNMGAHSIEAHGIRIGRYKPVQEDWSRLTEDMIHRVREDVEIGLDFYFYLMKEWKEQRARPHPVTGLDVSSAYYTELRLAFATTRQELRGFRLDVGYAGELLRELDPKLISTERAFRPHMPQRIIKKKTIPSAAQEAKMLEFFGDKSIKKEFLSELSELGYRGSKHSTQWSLTNKWTKKGSKIKADVTKHFKEMRGYLEDIKDPIVAGAFTPIEFEDIPLGSYDPVKQVLYKYGWIGVNFNDTEKDYMDEHNEWPKAWSGKIDDDSIQHWKKHGNPPEWAVEIANWYILSSRRGQILNIKDVEYYKLNNKWPRQASKKSECRGMLPKCICQDTGMTAQQYYEENKMWPDSGHWRIPAIAFSCATNTFRMRHRNVVNVPSRGLYGKAMRRLFIANKGKKVLGCDGAGLELRMLAHFMNDAEYTETVLSGDIHTYNQLMAGLPERDTAKTFIYAFLYGSGVPNLAAVCGMSTSEMGKCIARFKRKLPKLAQLLEGVEKAGAKHGYLLALDGRWGRIRSTGGKLKLHTTLNVLLQMTGSILMKVGHCLAEDKAVEMGVIEAVGEFPLIAHVHDEAQMEVSDDAEEHYYTISKSEWDAEEKREYELKGKIYSAPCIVGEEGDTLQIKRYYHPIGHCYAWGIREAGKQLGIRIATAGEYMLGESWEQTH